MSGYEHNFGIQIITCTVPGTVYAYLMLRIPPYTISTQKFEQGIRTLWSGVLLLRLSSVNLFCTGPRKLRTFEDDGRNHEGGHIRGYPPPHCILGST